jgi:hypothetical protein
MRKEMMAILQAFRVPSVNLLQFMVKENYPVRPETLDEGDIEHKIAIISFRIKRISRISVIVIGPSGNNLYT